MRFKPIALVASAALAVAACGLKSKSSDDKDSDKPENVADGGGTGTPPTTPPVTPGDDHGGDDHGDGDGDGHTVAPARPFTVEDLSVAADDAVKALAALNRPSATAQVLKTWLEPDNVWARLTYTDTNAEGQTVQETLLRACHFHGTELACHKKRTAGALEPADDVPSDDDDLPPVEEQ